MKDFRIALTLAAVGAITLSVPASQASQLSDHCVCPPFSNCPKTAPAGTTDQVALQGGPKRCCLQCPPNNMKHVVTVSWYDITFYKVPPGGNGPNSPGTKRIGGCSEVSLVSSGAVCSII